MKRFIGNVFCILAILLIVSLSVSKPQRSKGKEQVQDWAVASVFLTLGLALSKKKPIEQGKQ